MTVVAARGPVLRPGGWAGPGRWLLRRVGISVITVVISTVAVFFAARLLPGDPILALTGAGLGAPTEEELQIARDRFGLNDPMPVQYLRWVAAAVQGDFGVSSQTGADVGALIGQRLPVTLQLALCAMAVAVIVGGVGGTLAALRRGRTADVVISGTGVVGISVPSFWLGMVLILVFGVWLRVLPAGGYVPFAEDPVGWARSMLLPAVTLGFGLGSLILRQMRSVMIDALQGTYMDTARMKGLRGARLSLHAVRNGMVPLITVAGLQLGGLLSGAVVAELLFVIPGIGQLVITGVGARDYAVVQAVSLVIAVGYVLITLVVDVLCFVVDPRLRSREAVS